MFADFSKYNNEIIDVIMNEYEDELTLQTSLYKIKINAYGECCSCSKLKQYNDFDFKNLIGKVISKVKIINKLPDDLVQEEDEDGDYTSYCFYEISFKNSSEKFNFLMVNYSNGYYSGWISTNIVL